MKRFIRVTETISQVISGHAMAWVILLLGGMVMAEVITRYLLRQPLRIADEMGAYMVIAITFIGLAYAAKEKTHVRVTFVVDKLPTRVRNWMRVATLTIATAFVPVLIYAYIHLIEHSYTRGIMSSSWLRVPLVWPRLVLLIGAVLLLLQLIVEVIKAVRVARSSKDILV